VYAPGKFSFEFANVFGSTGLRSNQRPFDSYSIFSPGQLMPSGDIAALATRAFAAAFRIGIQLSAPFLVFGLVFNIGLGVLARLMPQMQVYFVGVPLSILAGFLVFALVITAMMGTFLDYFIGVMHELIPLK
jgi:flagellar biosynthetic protein FliR